MKLTGSDLVDSIAVKRHRLTMATLTVRDLPDDIRTQLRIRAAQNGRSMEAEVRRVLEQAVRQEPTLPVADRVRRMQAEVAKWIPKGSYTVDDFLREKREETAREEAEYRSSLLNRADTQRL